MPTTYRPRTDHIHVTPTHIPTAYRPHTCNTDLIPTVFTDHIPTDQLVHCYPLCCRSVGSAQTRPGGAACDRWGSCHLASFGHESAGTLRGVPVVDCERVRRVTICNSKIQRNVVAIVPREKNSEEVQLPCPEKQPTCAFWARTPGKPYSSETNERGNCVISSTELMEWFLPSHCFFTPRNLPENYTAWEHTAMKISVVVDF